MRSKEVAPHIRRRIRRRATRLVLSALCGELRQGRYGVLTGLGFSRTQIASFQQLRLQDLHRLGLRESDWLEISVDHARLDHVLRSLLGDVDEERLISRLIQRGASQDVMAALFGMSTNELVARRRALGVPESAGGRCRLPVQRERDAIVDRWYYLEKDEPCPRRRLLQLADSFDWPVAALWRTIRLSERLQQDDEADESQQGSRGLAAQSKE
jgi:hypothetical protein